MYFEEAYYSFLNRTDGYDTRYEVSPVIVFPASEKLKSISAFLKSLFSDFNPFSLTKTSSKVRNQVASLMGILFTSLNSPSFEPVDEDLRLDISLRAKVNELIFIG
jgi:hypothetical protein